ncbi:MAG: hypothetical protein FJ086_01645 [Deltaproteobacteria bacterium]|nr:hypothetical protein [Deltaproteobacteria bacterium]
MTALPDVNVLLAVAWPNHQHHAVATAWFGAAAGKGWATCALTELAFVRLSSNPAFTRQAVSPATALELLAQLKQVGKHRAWDELPGAGLLKGLTLAGHQQVMDAYLLRLAEAKRGTFVTFDRGARAFARDARHVLLLSP